MEGLTQTLLNIIAQWSKAFAQKRTVERVKELCLGLYLTLGKKTISRNIATSGKDQEDWSAVYKVFNRSNWDPKLLFRPLIEESVCLSGMCM